MSESWRKNLYAIFIAEFVVIMGFSFVNPFMPLYVQEVGGLASEDAAFWAGIATSAAGIAMFFSAPLWGIVADRWGRKPMVLRAMFGASVVLALTGLAPNVWVIVGLRFMQGMFSGTVAAASALVASMTPRDRLPFAMGLLMTAVFTGTTVGPLIGGWTADNLGYPAAFFITSGLLATGGIIVTIFVREQFQRPEQGKAATLSSLWRLASSRQMLPLLAVLAALHAGPQMISPIISLFIKELDPAGAAATASGIAYSMMGVVAAGSAALAGRLGQRVTLKRILVFSCVGTGLLYLPPMWAGTVTQVLIFVALTGLMKGGIMTSSNALVGLSAPPSQQGIAYGVAQSANALGSGLGPLLGGALAPLVGLRSVFGITGGVFVVIGLGVTRLLSGVQTGGSVPEGDRESA
jgi:DHA1 family multidrug resistance protein-like MFS transporter